MGWGEVDGIDVAHADRPDRAFGAGLENLAGSVSLIDQEDIVSFSRLDAVKGHHVIRGRGSVRIKKLDQEELLPLVLLDLQGGYHRSDYFTYLHYYKLAPFVR